MKKCINKYVHALLVLAMLMTSGCSPSKTDTELLQSAKDYINNNQIRESILELKNALQVNPQNAEARFLLGKLNLAIGNPASAVKEFERSIEYGWDEAEATLYLARSLLNNGQFNELATFGINETFSKETQANLHGLVGAAYLARNEIVKTSSHLDLAANLDQNSLYAKITRIRLMLVKDDRAEAKRILDKALQMFPGNQELLLLSALISIEDGNIQEAIASYEAVLAKEPTKIVTAYARQARLGLARIYVYGNQLPEAEKILEPLHQVTPGDPEFNYLLGHIALQKQDYSQAEERLLSVLKVAPDHSNTHLLFGVVNYEQKDYEQAAYYISKFLAKHPDTPSVRKLLGKIYLALGQHEEAQQTLTSAGMPGDDAELQAMISLSQFRQGNVEAGLQGLKRAAEVDPENKILRRELIKAYIASGETSKAIDHLKKEIAGSKDVQDQALLVSAYLRAGEFDNAINTVLTMRAKNPDNININTLAGVVFAASGDLDKAREYFNEVLGLHPKDEIASLTLARVEEIDGNTDKAIALYENLASQPGGSSEPLLQLANLYRRSGNDDELIKVLNRAVSSYPEDPRGYILLCDAYLQKGEIEKTDKVLKAALLKYANEASLKTIEGRILLAKGEFNKSLPILQGVVEANPGLIVNRVLLAENHLALNQPDEAIKQLKMVLEKQPFHLPAMILIARAHSMIGDFTSALSQALNVQKSNPDFPHGYELEGDIWSLKKDFIQSAKAFSTAYDLKPSSELALKYARAQYLSGHTNEAITVLSSSLNTDPGNIRLLLFRADLYQMSQQQLAALDDYESIIALDAHHAVALNNAAWIHDVAGNHEKGLMYARRAHDISPNDPGIQDTYGWLLVRNNDSVPGLELLESARKLLSDSNEVQYHYAAALSKLGRYDEARSILAPLIDSGKEFDGRSDAEVMLKKLEN